MHVFGSCTKRNAVLRLTDYRNRSSIRNGITGPVLRGGMLNSTGVRIFALIQGVDSSMRKVVKKIYYFPNRYN